MTAPTFTIYTLTDPRSHDVGYVGVTTASLKKRLMEHVSPSCPGYTCRARWISDLAACGLRPRIDALYVVGDARTARALEVSTIRRFLLAGVPLTNALEVRGSYRIVSREPKR